MVEDMYKYIGAVPVTFFITIYRNFILDSWKYYFGRKRDHYKIKKIIYRYFFYKYLNENNHLKTNHIIYKISYIIPSLMVMTLSFILMAYALPLTSSIRGNAIIITCSVPLFFIITYRVFIQPLFPLYHFNIYHAYTLRKLRSLLTYKKSHQLLTEIETVLKPSEIKKIKQIFDNPIIVSHPTMVEGEAPFTLPFNMVRRYKNKIARLESKFGKTNSETFYKIFPKYKRAKQKENLNG